ncbi:MAG: S24 family peptidase [Bacteroidota bacterium]
MERKEYISYLAKLTKHELYSLAREFIIYEHQNLLKNSWKTKVIANICNSKDVLMLKFATQDAIIIINSIENIMHGLKVTDIKRIDFFTNEELVNFVSTSIGGAKQQPRSDINSNERLDLYKFFGFTDKTIICQVSGISMKDAGIYDGDLLIVDTAREPKSGDIIVASLDSETFVKRIKFTKKSIWLLSENKEFPNLKITDEMNFKIIGVVKSSVTSHL